METTLDEIEKQAEALANARETLGKYVRALNAGLEALKANKMPAIRAAIDVATDEWGTLEALIAANPGLFVKPRTVAAHGISFGMALGKGRIEIPDPARTVALIRKHLPEQAKVLIAVEEVPVKKAVEKLEPAMLKRIGVNLIAGVDQVVIRPAPSDIDKLVKALVTADVAAKAEVSAGT